MSKAPLSRAGAAPGSLGLTGTAGLQFKPKKFGLQKPKPLAAAGFGAAAGSASIFGEVADDDPVSVREELRRLAESKQKKAAAHAAQAAVLAQDPSIYDYDGAYDSITNERESAREAKKGKAGVEKKSRYIGSIMEAHKEREIENDKIFERRLVKEAEAEAHLYGDKDKFITSAYRKKLEAREAYEAEQAAKEEVEKREDVTKRADMRHFYSNLLEGKTAPNATATKTLDDAYMHSGKGSQAGGAAAAAAGGGAAGGAAGEAEAEAADDGLESHAEPAGGVRAELPSEEAAAGAAAEAAVGAETTPEEGLARAVRAAVQAPRPTQEEPSAPQGGAGGKGGGGLKARERSNDDGAVESARERYLARKRLKGGSK